MLNISQTTAAKRAGVGRRTLVEFENRTRVPHNRVLRDIREAFERDGIVFIDADESLGSGVRFSSTNYEAP